MLNERPAITFSQQWLWDAFWALSKKRARGFGAQPLLYSEIEAYCRVQELSVSDSRTLTYVVNALDDVWMSWADKEGEKKDG